MDNNPRVRINVNKIQNRVRLKTKTGHYPENLTSETMKLLESTKSKITNDKNGENFPHLAITGVVLVHCHIVNNDYQHDLRALLSLFEITLLVNYYIFHMRILYLSEHLIQRFHILKYDLLIKVLNH